MKRSLPEPLLFRISTFFAVAFAANAVFANGTSMLFAVDSYTFKPEKLFTYITASSSNQNLLLNNGFCL